MSDLFDRVYTLRVGEVEIGTSVSGRTAHNVRFSIERTLRRRPNRCEVSIWNLDESQRRALQRTREGISCELLAGYASDGGGLIFRGDLHNARTAQTGPDLVTKITSRDGGRAHAARTARTARPGTSIATVVGGLVEDLGIGAGNLPGVLGGLRIGDSSVFSAGATFFGSASDELDRVLTGTGHEWSIQDGALQVLPRGRSAPGLAFDLRPETGLISRPARNDRNQVEVDTLMIPAVRPGSLVRLEAGDEVGTFRVERMLTQGEFRSTAATSWGHHLVLGEVTT